MTNLLIFGKKKDNNKLCVICNKIKRRVYKIDASDIGLNENYHFYSCLKCFYKARLNNIFFLFKNRNLFRELN